MIFLSATENAKTQTTQEAVNYLNQFSDQYKPIQKESWDYMSTLAHSRSGRKIEKRRIDLVNAINKSRREVKKIPAFNNDYTLRDSVVAYLTLNYNILNNDYDKIVDMEAVAEQSYDLMEAYILAQELAGDKMEQALKNLNQEIELFAEKYEIKLIESDGKLEQKLEKSSEAMDYYHQVYLVFFKAYKQEAYLMDAITNSDINSMEQNRNALKSISEEGIQKLTEISNHRGDNTINSACKRMLTFYIDEADNKIPLISDFLLVAKEYEEMSTLINSKDRMQVSQEEIDRYNKAVDGYNKAVNKYNANNKALNSKRNSNLDIWNNAVNSFMDRHIPKK